MTSFRVTLKHDRGETPIWIGPGEITRARTALEPWWRDRTVFLVSSERVAQLHGERVRETIAKKARVVELSVPDGEVAKSVHHAERLWQQMLEQGGKRDSRVVALGGGSVTDLGGFVAGTFLRGIEVVQIPTTLLAQVDASVGGKTGIDLPDGKNTVGLFLQPHAVIADTEVLATLPREELRAGLVESIKKGALLAPELFETIERDLDAILAGDPEKLGVVVEASVRAKAEVVAEDPYERGRRKLLNFGHTLGHALEAALGYRGLRHGEAVAYGLLFAIRVARDRGLGGELNERLPALLARLDLAPLDTGELEVETLLSIMAKDKKARESGLTWILGQAPGSGVAVSDVSMERIHRLLAEFLADPWEL